MDYTLPQVLGYLRASQRLDAEDLARQALAARAAQQDAKDWRAWLQALHAE